MRRRSLRAALLWLAAAAVAALTASVVATDLATLHQEAHELGPRQRVAVATRDLVVGTTITDADLTARRVHRSQLPPHTLSLDATRGRVVTVPVLRGGFVTAANLAPRHRRRTLDSALPPGTRALRIVAGDSLRPPVGSSVDVLATIEAGAAGGVATPEPTVVVARGVLVLATDGSANPSLAPGHKTPGTGTDAGRGVAVTLLVNDDQARRLAFAAATSVITLALVPPEDAVPRGVG